MEKTECINYKRKKLSFGLYLKKDIRLPKTASRKWKGEPQTGKKIDAKQTNDKGQVFRVYKEML